MANMEERIASLRSKANALAEQPGVYLMKNKHQEIIYVGKAKRLKHRVVSYFRQNKMHNQKQCKMIEQIQDFDYIICDSEFEALVLECSLIKQYAPKYNILLKDDKGYHYIKITDESYPRIQAAKQKAADTATYLGPYVSQFSVTQSVDAVNKVFGLPTCNRRFPQDFNKMRPCLNFYIKQCEGLCQGKISQEQYAERIKQAMTYLKQGSAQFIEEMERQMNQAAEKLEFEKAAKMRDKIKAMKRLNEKQKVLSHAVKEQDFIGMEMLENTACVVVLKFRNGVLHDTDDYIFHDVYDSDELMHQFMTQYYLKREEIPKVISLSKAFGDIQLYQEYLSATAGHSVQLTVPARGEQSQLARMTHHNALEKLSQQVGKKSKEITALKQLGDLLGLPKEPIYIESYDISNIGNDYIVGGMVVFEHAKPLKSAYKKFKMKQNVTQDDYACLSEMISRRFRNYFDDSVTDAGFKRLPDLILLDGGKGHVSVITQLLADMNLYVPVYGMVKDSKHKTRAIAKQGGEIQISGAQAAFRLVTQVQEEVHRFAIGFQRKTHHKKAFGLELTSIPGIGEKRAFSLLKAFKTQKALREASVDQIQSAARLGEKTAQDVYNYLHQD